MRGRIIGVVAVLLAVTAHVRADDAVFDSPDAALAWAESVSDGFGWGESDDETSTKARKARGVFDDAMRNEPARAEWAFGMALATMLSEEHDLADAQPHFERAAELEPNVAKYEYWRGNALAGSMLSAGLGALGRLGDVREAYERAIELDPMYPEPRIALAMVYTQAPRLLGGSSKKAMEQGEALLRIPGAESQGHIVIAGVHAKKKRWDEMGASFEAAASSAPNDEDRRQAVETWFYYSLSYQQDGDALVPIAQRLVAMTEDPDDPMPGYLSGVAYQEAGRAAEALPLLIEAGESMPERASAQWRVCEALEDVGRRAAALSAYERVSERFPDDERAKTATKRARRLR
ncbi:MAG: tetratricopeptide repeat protein [Planctomycetota bacterium]